MDVSEWIEAGLFREAEFIVEEAQTAAIVGSGPTFSDDGRLEVLSTPSLIMFMERISFRMLSERLPENLTSVGVSLQVNHIAPSLFGAKVRIRSEVSTIEGRRVSLRLQAWDGKELVGEGVHQRVVVDREAFLQRLQAKRDS